MSQAFIIMQIGNLELDRVCEAAIVPGIKKGWSQQDLAVKAGLSYNAVTKLEQGTAIYPRLDTLLKLADVFNITIDELIGRKIK